MARAVGADLLKAGYAPLVPHLTCFMASNTPSACGGGISHEEWLDSDLAWVDTAHALLRLPGESKGADQEVAYAEAHGIPVYHSIRKLWDAVKPRQDPNERLLTAWRRLVAVTRRQAATVSEQRRDAFPLPSLVAFTGFAGAGKDEAAKWLSARGYKRHNFGDIIKKQIDPIVQENFGFSAFTEDRDQKAKIRRVLEEWGEANYQSIMDEYFADLTPPAVNTRLVRVQEAEAWKARGGRIIEVRRANLQAATQWEYERLRELHAGGFIDSVIGNDGTPEDLHRELVRVLQHLA